MLAPYISMDDDFQLTILSSLPEEDDKTSSSEPSAVASAVSRKRYERLLPHVDAPSGICQSWEEVT